MNDLGKWATALTAVYAGQLDPWDRPRFEAAMSHAVHTYGSGLMSDADFRRALNQAFARYRQSVYAVAVASPTENRITT